MFGSTILDVVVGLVFVFLVVSLVASAVIEFVAMILKKRAKDLHATLNEMLGQASSTNLATTSVLKALKAASGKSPSYLSATAFADAVVEMLVDANGAIDTGNLSEPLKTRVEALRRTVGDELLQIKSGLETWFDATMERLEGSFKRWSQWRLLVAGLVIAAFFNISTIHVVDTLWNDAAIREAVTNAAGAATTDGDENSAPPPIEDVAMTVDQLDELGLPVGWDRSPGEVIRSGDWPLVVVGWFLTAGFVMFGAPFWYETLTKLVSLRSTGRKPPRAEDDPSSATRQIIEP